MKTIKELFSLNGKIAVVTGGAGHLGVAISESLHEAGAIVFILQRHRANFDKYFKDIDRYHFIEGDICNKQSIQTCYKEIVNQYGRIDILVNNAFSMKGGGCLPEEISDDIWSFSADGVLGSTFRCIREVIPYMENNGGAIVNIASMYGVISPDLSMYSDECRSYLNPIHYGTFKAGIIQMTKYYGMYLISKNINVNCITPGTFPSPTVQKNEEFVKRLKQKNPSHRIGTPEDIKGAILFLSSEASKYMVGQNIIIDGGWTIW